MTLALMNWSPRIFDDHILQIWNIILLQRRIGQKFAKTEALLSHAGKKILVVTSEKQRRQNNNKENDKDKISFCKIIGEKPTAVDGVRPNMMLTQEEIKDNKKV